jgi:hypothetical protein
VGKRDFVKARPARKIEQCDLSQRGLRGRGQEKRHSKQDG